MQKSFKCAAAERDSRRFAFCGELFRKKPFAGFARSQDDDDDDGSHHCHQGCVVIDRYGWTWVWIWTRLSKDQFYSRGRPRKEPTTRNERLFEAAGERKDSAEVLRGSHHIIRRTSEGLGWDVDGDVMVRHKNLEFRSISSRITTTKKSSVLVSSLAASLFHSIPPFEPSHPSTSCAGAASHSTQVQPPCTKPSSSSSTTDRHRWHNGWLHSNGECLGQQQVVL